MAKIDPPSEMAEEMGTVVHLLFRVLRQAALPKGMSLAQAGALTTLGDAGPQRITVLAQLEHVTQPSMSSLIAGMERRGWVRRLSEGSDRRCSVIELTEAGYAALEEIAASRSHVIRNLLTLLTPADRNSIARAIPALRRLGALAGAERLVEG